MGNNPHDRFQPAQTGAHGHYPEQGHEHRGAERHAQSSAEKVRGIQNPGGSIFFRNELSAAQNADPEVREKNSIAGGNGIIVKAPRDA